MGGVLFLNGHEFRVEHTMIEATSMTVPDLSWHYTDPNGHEHRWVDGKVPSLVSVSDGEYWCSDCNDMHEWSHYECLLCNARVEPKTRSNSERHYVPGLKRLYVDGRPVSFDEWKESGSSTRVTLTW